jgi:hypothetical protein
VLAIGWQAVAAPKIYARQKRVYSTVWHSTVQYSRDVILQLPGKSHSCDNFLSVNNILAIFPPTFRQRRELAAQKRYVLYSTADED